MYVLCVVSTCMYLWPKLSRSCFMYCMYLSPKVSRSWMSSSSFAGNRLRFRPCHESKIITICSDYAPCLEMDRKSSSKDFDNLHKLPKLHKLHFWQKKIIVRIFFLPSYLLPSSLVRQARTFLNLASRLAAARPSISKIFSTHWKNAGWMPWGELQWLQGQWYACCPASTSDNPPE